MQNNYFSKSLIEDVLENPSKNSKVSSQIIYGEKFKVLSDNKNFYKIKTNYDKYVGYISKRIKIGFRFNPTHKICILKSRIFIGFEHKKKIASKRWLPFGSNLQIIKTEKKFIMFEKNKWVKRNDISPIKKKDKNFLKILKYFINCKYKWGGKTFKGIDCSALVQIYYKYNNKFFPRDTVDQVKIKKGSKTIKYLKKGDIIFWKGHVAICINSKKLIHAYGPEKKVVIMPIQKTINRIKSTANLAVKKVTRI